MIKKILVLTAMTLTSLAHAQRHKQVETITVLKKQLVDRSTKLKLRSMVLQKLSDQGLSLNNFTLVGVTLRGESSFRGNSKVTLIVGRDRDTKTIHKRNQHASRRDDRPRATLNSRIYKTLNWDLSAQPGQKDERWQVEVEGRLFIDSLQVHLRSKKARVSNVRIPVNQTLLRGENLKVRLRTELKRQGYLLKNIVLQKVVLVAKSRRGLAKVKLNVGKQHSRLSRNIEKSIGKRTFKDEDHKTYNRIEFNVKPQKQDDGPWFLDIDSNDNRTKVKAVIVEVARKRK